MAQGAREIRVVEVIRIAAAIPTAVVMLKTVSSFCFLGQTSTWLEKGFSVRFWPVVESYLADVIETVTRKASFLIHLQRSDPTTNFVASFSSALQA